MQYKTFFKNINSMTFLYSFLLYFFLFGPGLYEVDLSGCNNNNPFYVPPNLSFIVKSIIQIYC